MYFNFVAEFLYSDISSYPLSSNSCLTSTVVFLSNPTQYTQLTPLLILPSDILVSFLYCLEHWNRIGVVLFFYSFAISTYTLCSDAFLHVSKSTLLAASLFSVPQYLHPAPFLRSLYLISLIIPLCLGHSYSILTPTPLYSLVINLYPRLENSPSTYSYDSFLIYLTPLKLFPEKKIGAHMSLIRSYRRSSKTVAISSIGKLLVYIVGNPFVTR